MSRIGCVLLMMVCWMATVLAQEPVFKNYTTANGLPSNDIYCIMQDAKGFIWLGTDGGISKFDGYHFRNYTTANGLSDNTVFEIQEDRHRRMWMRTLSGKFCYLFNDSILSIEGNDSIAHYLNGVHPHSFYIDSKDTLWFPINKYPGSYMKIASPYSKKDIQIVHLNIANPFVVFIEGKKFIYNVSGHIPFLQYTIYRKEHLDRTIPIKSSDYYSTHFLPSDDALYFCNDSIVACTKHEQVIPLIKSQQLSTNRITFLNKIDSVLWIGTIDKGVFKFSRKTAPSLSHYQPWLKGQSVTCVMKDAEGGIWFSTEGNGLYYSSPDYFTNTDWKNERSTMAHSIFNLTPNSLCITKNKDSLLLAANDTVIGNFSLRNPAPFYEKIKPLPVAFPLLVRTGNRHVVGNYASYVAFTNRPFTFKPVFKSPQSNEYGNIFTYATDTALKRIYITYRYTLQLLDEKRMSIGNAPLFRLPAHTLSITLDEAGTLWMGTLNGVWLFKQDTFVRYKPTDKLYSSRINKIIIDKNGTKYFATLGNGLIIEKNGRTYHLTTQNGLISNNCETIFLDSYANLWVGTKTGIGSLNLNSPVSNYSKLIASNRGLIGRKIHQINQSGNTLWVNTDAGIVVKKLSASDIIVKDPPVYITEYSINETNYLGNTNRVCSYNENNIKISFVGISYQSFGNLTYEYTLEGIDTKWNYTQNTTIQYPYLPPGNYTFRVKLAGNKSNPATVATLSFTITPPFWNTLLFKIAMVGMLLATVIAFFLYRIKRIKKADEEKIRITKMIAEMEAKAIRAQMNPHFIFNALNSVQNFILKNDRMQAQDYLAKFARLIRHVLDNSKQEMIPLHKEIEALTLYLQLEQLRIPQKFSFTIHCSPQIDIAQTQIPPLLMQPFVENALLHGITHKKDLTGIIHITIDKTTTQLICNIEDNGIGRKKSMAINAAKETLHESFGMSATKERIEILNLHHPNMASVRIIDKIDDANLATGTTVVITIPLILKPA